MVSAFRGGLFFVLVDWQIGGCVDGWIGGPKIFLEKLRIRQNDREKWRNDARPRLLLFCHLLWLSSLRLHFCCGRGWGAKTVTQMMSKLVYESQQRWVRFLLNVNKITDNDFSFLSYYQRYVNLLWICIPIRIPHELHTFVLIVLYLYLFFAFTLKRFFDHSIDSCFAIWQSCVVCILYLFQPPGNCQLNQ